LDIIPEKAVESTTSAYCTDSSRLFDDFSPHRMGDTDSVKNHQKASNNQHIRNSRYDSTAFSRIMTFDEDVTDHYGPTPEIPGEKTLCQQGVSS
jgi:hypothetical protein